MSYKDASDSVFQIVDHTYDTTNHMFYVERTRFNGIDRRFVYDSTGSVPNNPSYRRSYVISGADSIESKFDYDSVGNVIRVYDNLGQVSVSIQYDSTLTYPYITASRLGLVDTTNYDVWTGHLVSAISPNGTKREFEYDNADRLIRARRVGDSCDNLLRYYTPDHRGTVDSILIDSSPCRYRIERKTYTIFNLLAQSRVDSVYNYQISGQYNSSIVDYEYNRQLRLKRRSNPHFDNELYGGLKWTEYRYDYAGRPVTIDYPNTTNDDGSTSSNISRFAYTNYDEIQYDWLNRRSTRRGDRLGRLVWTEYEDSSAAGDFVDNTTINYLGNTSLQSSIVMPGNKTISYTYDNYRRIRTATKPNEGTDTLYHDKMGNLRFKCDSRGIWTSFKYDSLFRLIEVRTSTTVNKDSVNSLYYMPTGTSRISYIFGRYDFSGAADTLNAHYDTTGTGYNAHRWIKGMLTQVNDEACTTLFLYDQQGRVAKKYIHYNPVEKWTGSYVSSGFKMISYKYTSADAIESVRYPRDTTWLEYEYGKSGLLARVPGFIQYHVAPTGPAVAYTPWGAVARTDYVNTMRDEKLYDNLMRIVRNTSYDGVPYDFGESYKYNGHRLTQVYKQTSLSGSTKITDLYYDYRDRIDSVGYLGEGEIAKYGYEYDQADNRTEVRKWVGGTLNSRTFYNNYSGSEQLRNTSTVQNDTTTKYTYDAHGNTLTDLTKKLSYRYDYRQMLDTLIHVSVHDANKRDTIIYGYNYLNQRVWKLSRFWFMDECVGEDPPNEDFFQGEDGGDEGTDGGGGEPMLCPKQWADLTFYVWSGDEVIAEYNISDALKNQYIYANGEMAATIWRSTAGTPDTAFVHHDYLGNARLTSSEDGGPTSLEYFDIWGESRQMSGSTMHNYRFIGRERDVQPWEDHHYLRHRFYNPSTGRFLTPDPITSGINPYAYCNQNPVMYNDRSGLDARLQMKLYTYTKYWYAKKQVKTSNRPDFVTDVPMPEHEDNFGDGPTAGEGETGPGGTGGGGGGGGGNAPWLKLINTVLADRMEEARKINLLEWLNKVRPHGDWDLKDQYPGMQLPEREMMQDLGNFNYGQTGTMQGFSEEVLLRAAGLVQLVQHALNPSRKLWNPGQGYPWGSAPYGDTRADQAAIQEGIRFVNEINRSLRGADRDATIVRY